MGSLKTPTDFKGMSDDDVFKLAKRLKVTWKEHTHVGINRMRAIMAIKEGKK